MKLWVEMDKDIARYSCDSCYNCKSEIGKSHCGVKHRGCCFYYPKFNLVDIQRMVQEKEGQATLQRILNNVGTEVHMYHLHCKGYFDSEGYERFLKTYDEDEELLEDKSLYFKACPFVVDGKGCTISPRFRTPVCNFFICDEIKGKINNESSRGGYEKEGSSFWRWYDKENEGLIYLLREKGLTLKNNLNEVCEVLKNEPRNIYEFPLLKKVEVEEEVLV